MTFRCSQGVGFVIAAVLAMATSGSPGMSDEPAGSFPEPYNSQEETIPPLSPQEALAKIRVPQGFRVSLFAAEPDVRNPIAFCTDARGRLWVAENYTYAESKLNFDTNLRDRILIFEDTDGDGVFDKRTVFWDQAVKLTSVAVGFGGVWVTCAPHLLFIPDQNGDDIPDGPPVVLLDGFNGDLIRHNIVNGLKWGPDGWLYGRHGITTTSKVGAPGCSDSERISINCGVWRYHPQRHIFEAVAHGTTNPWGMDWDSLGECWLINTVIGHLWHVVPGAHWERMFGNHFNPHLYQLIPQAADHFHWDTGEAWSDIRKGISQTTDAAGGGHAHSGLIYCDRSWPREYQNSILAGNFHGRRLNRDVLHREGNGFVAKHAPDMFFSDDPYFRIIDMATARDGGMYLADWSDIGECHENDGVHRTSGRIYKLTWEGCPEAANPIATGDLTTLSNLELVALQRRPGEWYPRAARLILHERTVAGQNLDDAVTALAELLQDSDPVIQLRGLWGLYVIGHLSESQLITLLYEDHHEAVHTWAVRLLLESPNGLSLLNDLGQLEAVEKSNLVRLYLASAMQRLPDDATRLQWAATLSRFPQDANDRQLPLLLWYGLEPAVVRNPAAALALARESASPRHARFVARRLTLEIKTFPEGAAEVVKTIAATASQPHLQRELLTGMTEALSGWRRAPLPAGWNAVVASLMQSPEADIVQMAQELSVVFGDGRAIDSLRTVVLANEADIDSRRAAIRSLVEARTDGINDLLLKVIDNRELTVAAVSGMAVLGDPRTPSFLAERYRRMRDDGREATIIALVSRPDFAPTLLDAVAKGQIPKDDVVPFQLRQILTFGNEALSKRIHELWPEVQQLSEARQDQIRTLTESLTPDTLAAANLGQGRVLYQAACAKCHKLYGEGGATAPDLTGAQRSNLHYLLENIIDPSATISENYKMSVVILDDGRVLNGVVVDPTEQTIGLQTATERLTLDRDSIEEIRESNLSLMPEGQLDRLTPEEIRNLIGYLMSSAQVPLPQ